MRKQLVVSAIMMLCGLQQAFGQCGSAHGTDYDGSFASSTSSDPCGGHTLLQSELYPPLIDTQPAESHFGYFFAIQVSLERPEPPSAFSLSGTLPFETTITNESFTRKVVLRSQAQQAAAPEQLYYLDDRITVTLAPVDSVSTSRQSGMLDWGAYEA